MNGPTGPQRPDEPGACADGNASAAPAGASAPTVRRIDDRLGLAAMRVALAPRTLVTYARDHVTVRTPSQPGFFAGNTIDLEAVPAAEDLAGWITRFEDTVGQMGVAHVQLRWERPPGEDAGIDQEAAKTHGLALFAQHVWLIDADTFDAAHTIDPNNVQAHVNALPAPGSAPSADVAERQWHAATVLLRYLHGDHPDQWRAFDPEAVALTVDVQRELAAAGRTQVWVASRHGMPVGRVSLTHDRQGLATLSDLVVHPVHRRIGIGSVLLHRALRHHLDAVAGGRVAIYTDTLDAPLFAQNGFGPHATVWTARRTPGPPIPSTS